MSKRKTLYINNYISQFDLLDRTKLNVIFDSLKDLIHSDNGKPFVLLNDFGVNTLSDKHRIFFNVIDNRRQHDLESLKILKDTKIFNVPDYIYSFTYESLYPMLLGINKSLIFKPFDTARSLGKHIVKDGYEAMSLIQQKLSVLKIKDGEHKGSYFVKLDEEKRESLFNELFNIDSGDYQNHYEKYCLFNNINQEPNFILQETVPFTIEYRIVYMFDVEYKNFVIEQRTGYRPSSNVERKHEVITYSEFKSNPKDDEILKKVQQLGNELNQPAVSMDIYYNSNTNEYGIFEYSTQFGIDYDRDTLKILSKQYTNAILKFMENYNG